jgi:hypothetical protein
MSEETVDGRRHFLSLALTRQRETELGERNSPWNSIGKWLYFIVGKVRDVAGIEEVEREEKEREGGAGCWPMVTLRSGESRSREKWVCIFLDILT